MLAAGTGLKLFDFFWGGGGGGGGEGGIFFTLTSFCQEIKR